MTSEDVAVGADPVYAPTGDGTSPPSAPAPAPPSPSDGVDPVRVAGGVGLLLVGLAIVHVFANALSSAFDDAGVVDRRVVVVRSAASLVGAIVAGLGADVAISGWMQERRHRVLKVVVFLAVLGLACAYGWFLYAERPDAEYAEGDLSSTQPFARRVLISGGNGHRYYITFTPSGSLSAEVELRGGGTPIVGVKQDNGVQVIEGVLAGDATWIAVLRYLDGHGKYLIFVDSADPEKLSLERTRTLDRALEVGRTRVGYTFDVRDRDKQHDNLEPVFLRVASRRAGQPNPGVILRTSTGTPIDNLPAGNEDGLIFTKVPPGSYVVEVQGEPGQRYLITLARSDPGNPGNPVPTTLPPGDVDVPNVARLPEAQAVARLTEKGFVVQSFAVCSGTLADEQKPVGTTRQVVLASGAGAAETEVVGLNDVTIKTLPGGTSLIVKVFSGLRCN